MDEITFGLIGASLKHSLSPVIHNAVFKKLEINAKYQMFELEESQLGQFLSCAYLDSIRGLNVTIPYKEKVIQFLTRLDGGSTGAFAMGTVNTIKIEDKALVGYNTDGDGFIDALNRIELKEKREQFNFKDKTCVILGAGGVAKAVSFALAAHDVKALFIYDIDKPKARNLASKIKSKFPYLLFEVLETGEQLKQIGDSQILVNATPVGMKAADVLVVKEDFLHKDLFVFDCVYNPSGRKNTILVESARAKGARAFDGLWMLISQAIRSEKIWLPMQIPEDGTFEIMSQALRKEGYELC